MPLLVASFGVTDNCTQCCTHVAVGGKVMVYLTQGLVGPFITRLIGGRHWGAGELDLTDMANRGWAQPCS